MILDKKPTKSNNNLEDEQLKIIQKGGHVLADIKSNKDKYKFFNIRLPMDMSLAIDEEVSKRVGINKTGWILECIHEKLKKGKIEESHLL